MTSARDAIALTGIGMRTAVGNDTVQSCATIRTRLASFTAWPHGALRAQEDGVVVAPLDPDLGNRSWPQKAPAMSTQAVHEALWQAKVFDGRALRSQHGAFFRIGAWVAVPSTSRAGVDAADADEFRALLKSTSVAPLRPDEATLLEGDNAVALTALAHACTGLREGRISLAVVAALDSHLHMPWLETLAAAGRIAHEDDRPGFVPGEAAACLVLERASAAMGRGATPLAVIGTVAGDVERTPITPDQPIRAEAASRTVHECLDHDAARIRRVVADLNGERWRALEWGLVETRCLGALTKGWRLWHPADSIGDVGAASGAIAIGIGARAFARGYAEGGSVLVTCAGLAGPRAAAVIHPPTGGA